MSHSRNRYDRIVLYQIDPDAPAAGGVDSVLRDLLSAAPRDLRVLLVGVSRSRQLFRVTPTTIGSRTIDFMPVARLHALDRRVFLPHSVRVALGALIPLLLFSGRRTTLEAHRFELAFLSTLVHRKKLVVFAHTDPVAYIQESSDSFWKYAPSIYRKIEARVLSQSSATIVFSAAGAEYYGDRYSNVVRATTWYNDNEFFVRPGVLKRGGLLWVGRLESPKDPLSAVRVMRELADQDEKTWKLVMAGDGSLRSEVEAEIARLGLENNVALVGAVSRGDIARLMSKAQALLMTSRFEGSPVVLYEAMASGTPVVASAKADPDNVIIRGLNGLLCDDEPAALARAVRQFNDCDARVVASTVERRSMKQVVPWIWELTK